MRWLGLFALVLALLSPAGAVPNSLPLNTIKLPPGFQIDIYAEGVENARSMALSPAGILYVGTRTKGNVYAIVDQNKDQKADRVYTLATGLQMPNGVAFKDGALYLAEVNRVTRYDGIDARLASPPPPVVIYDRFRPSGTTAGSSSRSGPTESCMCRSGRRATSASRAIRSSHRSPG